MPSENSVSTETNLSENQDSDDSELVNQINELFNAPTAGPEAARRQGARRHNRVAKTPSNDQRTR